MLFNSLTFVVFFAVVVTLYWSIRSWNARKNLLVTASYIFYGAWNPPFAALLFSTTAMDFWLGRQIAKAKNPSRDRAWLVASVCMNLSMLGFFKYGNFLLENFQWLLARIGSDLPSATSRHPSPGRNFLLHVSILFPTPSIFIAASCNRPDHCAISFWRFPFFLSWSPDQSCAPVIFFRNWSDRRVYGSASSCGDCCL